MGEYRWITGLKRSAIAEQTRGQLRTVGYARNNHLATDSRIVGERSAQTIWKRYAIIHRLPIHVKPQVQ